MSFMWFFFLPAAMAIFWSASLLLLRPRVMSAQWLIGLCMLLMGFAISFMAIQGTRFVEHDFVFDALFRGTAALCPPIFYLFVTSATMPSGLTRRSRLFFLPTLLYLAAFGLTVYKAGSANYTLFMNELVKPGFVRPDGEHGLRSLIYVIYYGFGALMAVEVFLIVLHCTEKLCGFITRLRRYKADHPKFQTPPGGVVWSFYLALPFMVATMVCPYGILRSSVALSIIMSVLLACLLWAVGYYSYGLTFSAAQLRQLMLDEHMRERQSAKTVEQTV